MSPLGDRNPNCVSPGARMIKAAVDRHAGRAAIIGNNFQLLFSPREGEAAGTPNAGRLPF